MEAHRARLIREQNTREAKAAAIEKEMAATQARRKQKQEARARARAHEAQETEAARNCALALGELRQSGFV
jgi:hypothetical protein